MPDHLCLCVCIICTTKLDRINVLINHIARFLKLGILIYNSEVPDTNGRKTRKNKQAIAKCFVFQANAIRISSKVYHFYLFEIKIFCKGTLRTYRSQYRFRISSHLRKKEVLSCTFSLEKACSIWQ